MNLPPSVHTDGSCIKVIGLQEQSRIYIGILWSIRHKPEARACIRRHVASIRKFSSIEFQKAA